MKKAFLASLIFISILSSCSKSSTPAPNYPITGLWVGTYTNLTGTYFFSFSVFTDGSMSYQSTDNTNTIYYAHGTWSLNDTTFSFTTVTENYTPTTTQTATATYSKSKGTLTNGAGTGDAASAPFTFTMTKSE